MSRGRRQWTVACHFAGNNVYGVELFNGTKQIQAFTTAILPFYLVVDYAAADAILLWLQEARKAFKQPKFDIFHVGLNFGCSQDLQCEATGDALVSSEVRRMGFETAPLLIGSIAAMILFVLAFSGRCVHLKSTSQLLLLDGIHQDRSHGNL